MASRIFRVSRLDAITVVLAAAQVAGSAAGVVFFRRLPTWELLALAAALVFLMFLNVNGLAHTLIHGGVFRARSLDRVASWFNSLALGIPQTFYHVHHLNHHTGNSDRKRSDGSTRDWSSLYRYSRTNEPENVIVYSLLNLVRGDPKAMMREVRRRKLGVELVIEIVLLGAWMALLVRFDGYAFIVFYLPTFYVGWALSAADAYYKHWRVEPSNRYANSVSTYGTLYNLLTFNTGHHQEHHIRPGAHWTELPAIRAEFRAKMEAQGTRVIRGPHLFSFFHSYERQIK